MELPSLIRSLTLIDDRRNNKNKRYPLPLLLLFAFCASISKHDSWYTMQDYALAHEASIRELYKQLFGEELEHVTPSHDTLKIVPCKSHSPQGLQGAGQPHQKDISFEIWKRSTISLLSRILA